MFKCLWTNANDAIIIKNENQKSAIDNGSTKRQELKPLNRYFNTLFKQLTKQNSFIADIQMLIHEGQLV